MSSGVVLLLLRWIVVEEGGIERKAESRKVDCDE